MAIPLTSEKKAVVIQMAYLKSRISIHLACKTQIALLITEKIDISKEYSDFSNIFSKESVIVLFDHLDKNKHVIKLKLRIQLFYISIYNLGLIELETLKTYIEANLANKFIEPYKSLTEALIFPI